MKKSIKRAKKLLEIQKRFKPARAEEKHYMDLFSKATARLDQQRDAVSAECAGRNADVRLGAILMLEQIASNYLPLHWPIMEILCAFVRKSAQPSNPCSKEIRALYATPWKERVEKRIEVLDQHMERLSPPATHVQSALTVIGRRSKRQRLYEKELVRNDPAIDVRLDLMGCHLPRVNLVDLHFEGALFNRSCLEGATLEGTHFDGARLFMAHFEDASLWGASLRKADLSSAHFEGALFPETDLKSAMTAGAHFEGADMEYAMGLRSWQLEVAVGDKNTSLPNGLERPRKVQWGWTPEWMSAWLADFDGRVKH